MKSLRGDLLEVTSSSLAVHIFLDRAECLMTLLDAKLLSLMRLMTEGSRKDMWCQNCRFQLTRLETRTKEFIRMCEYVSQNAHMRNESER